MSSYGRLTLDEKAVPGHEYLLEGFTYKSLARWMPRIGEAVTVRDSVHTLFRARILSLQRDGALILVFEHIGLEEKEVDITLLQAVPQKERMELIIQKATELGAGSIIPFKSERSISIEERDSLQKKSHKWQEVALKAAKQSRRPDIPEISPAVPFEDALTSVKGVELKLMLWEKTGLPHIKEVLREARGAKAAAILSGPEGGFTGEEARKAEDAGFIPISLGRNILRAETASIISVGLIRHELA
ncbi:MAG: 16S rRNA (uracil(1498)-N(3))-methyltransferase [Deltaproteobacteria bacterium]|nr:16S rRNA (uracil(1498)-N(3))-methyltransferase [Deltaproteobacteria bacterium]